MLGRLILVGLLAQAVGVTSLEAQEAVPVGVRIRVTPVGAPARVGTFAGVAGDTLLLRTCTECALDRFAVSTLGTVQLSAGHKVDGRRARIGAVVGLVAGATFGIVHSGRCEPGRGLCSAAHLVEPIGGALLGGLAGLIPAFAFPIERWRPVSLTCRCS